MSAKEHLQRLMITARTINSKPYISITELLNEISHEMTARCYKTPRSYNTIKRDIQELREGFYIEIKYCRKNNGYYIDKTELGEIEFESLFEPFDMLYAMSVDGALPNFIHHEPCKPKGTKHLFDIINAIKTKKKISFKYSKFQNDIISDRLVSPYALKECRGRWYVIGKEKNSIIKTFGLDRIEHLYVLTLDNAEKPNGFNIENQFKYSYGIYSDPQRYAIEEIVLSFDAEDGGYLKSVPLHSSQEIIKDADDEFIIKLKLRLSPDFIMEILSRSWSLKVIAPLLLKEEICKIYTEALNRNM